MPSLGADMDAGTLVEWHVKPGDTVKRGQVVAVVETQKGAIEVEIWEDGTMDRLLVDIGAKVPVGNPLALVRAPGEAAGAAAPVAAPTRAAPAKPVQPAVAAVAPALSPAPTAPSRAKISPAARKRAEELGVDIATVRAAEPDAVVSRDDVERAARQQAKPAAGRKSDAPDWHAQMRKAIAAAMSRSKREIPHYYLATDIDVTRVTDWLAAENLKRDVLRRLLPVVPLMKAVALTLRQVPELNGTWVGSEFRPSPSVHLGMAIAMRGGGLVAPAIHDADQKSLDALMSDLRDLVTRVRGGRLRSSEMSDPTITLTNLGEQGVESVFGVIYPPQVAIVGLGRITDRARVENGAVGARKVLTATLAADHRVSDGHRGGLFLAALGKLLQTPEALQ